VYGTLERPVTAKNLAETTAFIKTRHPRSRLLVVDAALGDSGDIGVIRISRGGINPGAGVDKVLPSVGDVSITAVVSGLDGDKRLQLAATRLSLVYKLSLTIAEAIAEALKIRASLAALYA
jgi:putative sporulation protein YyaC